MDIMEFYQVCLSDSTVFYALQHEYSKKLIAFKNNVRGYYNSHPELRQINQRSIKILKRQIRTLKKLMNHIQSVWEV